MLVCNYCGDTIEENELEQEEETHFIDGRQYTEYFDKKCHCGGHYEKGYLCKICDEWKTKDDFCHSENECVCENCINSNANFDNAIKFGEEQKQSVKINGFIKEVLSEEKINEILIDYLKSNKLEKDDKTAEEFCLKDKWDFANFLEKEN